MDSWRWGSDLTQVLGCKWEVLMHSKYFFYMAILLGSFILSACHAQTSPKQAATDQAPTTASNEALIDAQIAAYNARDLEKFLGYYSDDVVLIDYPDQVTQSGKDAMRASYNQNFEDPDIRAAMTKRIVFGKFIVDHEQLTRAPAPGMIESVVIYEIKGGKIVRVTFLNK